MNEDVIKILNGYLWYLATTAQGPNVVPVAFKAVLEDGRLAIGDVFLETTLRNLEKNPQAAIAASDPVTMEGYQIKGEAQYFTQGPVVERFKEMIPAATNGALHAKGALIITPEQVIVTTPGPESKKVL